MGKGKHGRELPGCFVSRLSTTVLRRLRTWSAVLGLIAATVVSSLALALEAPNGPGLPSVWAPAAKDFIGTSAGTQSRVYFTGAEGVLTEVFYPTLDRVQNVDLQFLVTDAARTWGDEERRQQRHDISLVNKRAMVWQVVTTADSGNWRLTKKLFTDPGARHRDPAGDVRDPRTGQTGDRL
jgi:Glucodextranase, domain N